MTQDFLRCSPTDANGPCIGSLVLAGLRTRKNNLKGHSNLIGDVCADVPLYSKFEEGGGKKVPGLERDKYLQDILLAYKVPKKNVRVS
jgi:hypothetical protein